MMFLNYHNETRQLDFIDYKHDKVRVTSVSSVHGVLRPSKFSGLSGRQLGLADATALS